MNDRPGRIRIAYEELRSRMGFKCICNVFRRGKLRCFGHVKKMKEAYLMNSERSKNAII